MEVVQQIVTLALSGSLMLLVFSIGLDATFADLLTVLRRPTELAKAVLAVNVLVPLTAVILIGLFPLETPARVAIMLMAVSPVPPLAPGNQLKVGARKAYAYGLYTALILLSLVTVPLTVTLLGQFYDIEVNASAAQVAGSVVITAVAPLLLGAVIHTWAPDKAVKASAVVNKLAMIVLLIAVVPILVQGGRTIWRMAGDGSLAAIVIMTLVALGGGHLIGGPEIGQRAGLAVTAATRHPGIAITLATANAQGAEVKASIIAVLLVGLVAAFPYKFWLKRRRLAADPPPAARPSRTTVESRS